EPLHLSEAADADFTELELIRAVPINEPLSVDQRQWLLDFIDRYMLHGREGAPESWHHDERQRDLVCAKYLLEVGKEVYRAALGLERVRDNQDLREDAVELLKAHYPQTSIDHRDLYRFRAGAPSAELIRYVDEHLPGSVAKMRAYARELAGNK